MRLTEKKLRSLIKQTILENISSGGFGIGGNFQAGGGNQVPPKDPDDPDDGGGGGGDEPEKDPFELVKKEYHTLKFFQYLLDKMWRPQGMGSITRVLDVKTSYGGYVPLAGKAGYKTLTFRAMLKPFNEAFDEQYHPDPDIYEKNIRFYTFQLSRDFFRVAQEIDPRDRSQGYDNPWSSLLVFEMSKEELNFDDGVEVDEPGYENNVMERAKKMYTNFVKAWSRSFPEKSRKKIYSDNKWPPTFDDEDESHLRTPYDDSPYNAMSEDDIFDMNYKKQEDRYKLDKEIAKRQGKTKLSYEDLNAGFPRLYDPKLKHLGLPYPDNLNSEWLDPKGKPTRSRNLSKKHNIQ